MALAPLATVERLVVETTVHRSPRAVYEFLEDFEGYASYSEHLHEVRAEGSGEDRRYALTFAWWKLTYTVRTAVTDLDPPSRIAWRVVSELDASGRWEIEPVVDDSGADGDDAASGDGDADDAASGDGDADDAAENGEAADTADGAAVDDTADASRVAFVAEYDPSSVAGDSLDLPALVSLDWVVRKAKPLVEQEARRVVERAVADLEGDPREVDLQVTLESG